MLGIFQMDGEIAKIAVIHADDAGSCAKHPLHFLLIMRFCQDAKAKAPRVGEKLSDLLIGKDGCDEEDGRSPCERRLFDLADNYYSFTIVNAMQIVQIRKTDYNKFCKLAEADILGIDDIGTEPAEVQDYGNFIYPIKELLAMRYDAQLFTVFTTNLEPKEIRQRYGDRIADRLNEMMTKVVYRNLTYRTENAQMADSQG